MAIECVAAAYRRSMRFDKFIVLLLLHVHDLSADSVFTDIDKWAKMIHVENDLSES